MLRRLAQRGLSATTRRLGLRVERVRTADDEALYAAYDDAVLARRPFINVGAGGFFHRHWTNVDFGTAWYAESQRAAFVSYDLTALAPLPFEDATVELVYTSHTIEHVSDAAVANLFAECFRILRPGGGVRVTCPDADLFLRSMAHDRLWYWRWRRPWFSGPLGTAADPDSVCVEDYVVREIATPRCRFYVHARDPLQPATVRTMFREMSQTEFLDALVRDLRFDPSRPGDHINWWNEHKVETMLRAAGFEHVYASRRNQSLFPPLTNPVSFDDAKRGAFSLYVEAIR